MAGNRARVRLGDALRRAREAAGLSQSEMAAQAGIGHQTKVSKAEKAEQLLTPAEVAAWAAAAGAGKAAAARLLDLRAAASIEHDTVKAMWGRGGSGRAVQRDLARREQAAREICKVQPVIIPAEVQTIPYARAVLSLPTGAAGFGSDPADIEQMARDRVETRQKLMQQPGSAARRVITFEASLRHRPVPVEVMRGQLGRLLDLSDLPALDFGIVPVSVQVPIAVTSSFTIWDARSVEVEALSATERIADPDEVKRYVAWFGLLSEVAVRGSEMTDLVTAALRELN